MVNRIDIEVNAIGNFSQPIAQLAELKAAVAQIHSMPMLGNFGKEATMQIGAAQKAFDKAIISTRAFNMEMVKMSSHVDEFGGRLQAGQLKFGEYFKLYRQNVKGVASQLDELAASQARIAKSMVIPDALRSGYARVITNTTADLKTLGAAEEAAAIKAKLLNTTIHGMGTQLVNLGKNTQWAGRQLSMGLTMPIVAFGAAAAKTFKDVNIELTKLQRLYGKGVTPPSEAEIQKISDQALKLGKDIAQTMGIAQKETVATAASFAAIGLEGNKLIDATEQAMKLSKLGALTSEDAQRTIVAMQNVFKVSSTDLPNAVNFLASIQKQTSLSLQDISDAIPRVGPIIQQLGGSYKDAAVMMVAMKEAGIPAAQSANAIKSAVASMIAPTSAASEMFKKFGISLSGIKDKTNGNPIQMIEALQSSMKNLEPLAKAQLIEKLFGKFQFARVTALIENLGKAGSQTQTALQIAGASTSQLATLTNQEMSKAVDSVSSKWQRAVEGMKAQLQPFGEGFVKFGTKVVNVIEKILSFLNKFKPLKNLLVTVLGGAALVGPILMVVGLMGNFVGSIVKGVAYVREFGRGLKDGGIRTALSGMADSWKMIDKGSLAATETADMFESSVMKSTEAFSTLNFEVEKLKDKLMAIATMTSNGITTKFSPVAELGRYAASQNTLREMQALHPFFGSGGTVKNIERPHMSPAAKTWGGWQANQGGIQQKYPTLNAFLGDTNRFTGPAQQEAWMKHGTSEQWGRPVAVGGLAGTLQKAYSDEPVIHGTKFGTTREDVVGRGMAHIENIRARIISGDIAADSLVAKELEKIDAMPRNEQQQELMKVIESVTFTEKQFFSDMIETFVQTKAILLSDEEKVAALDQTMKGILADSSIADKPAAFAAVMTAFNEDFVKFGGTLVADVSAYRQIVTQTIMAGQTEFETAIAAASLRAGLIGEAEMLGGVKAKTFGAFKSMDKHATEQAIQMGNRQVEGFQRGGVPGFQSGVTSPWVPGSGSGDKIPAMLEPGEFVINRNAAQKYGSLLTDINFNKAPRFQTGGGIPGFQEGILIPEYIKNIMSYRGTNQSRFPILGKLFKPRYIHGMLPGENLSINNLFQSGDLELREKILNAFNDSKTGLNSEYKESIFKSIHGLANSEDLLHQKDMARVLDQMWSAGEFDNISKAQRVQIATMIEAANARKTSVSLAQVDPTLKDVFSKSRSGPRNKAWTVANQESALRSFGADPIDINQSLSKYQEEMNSRSISILDPVVKAIADRLGVDLTTDLESKRLVDLYVYGKQSTSRPSTFSPQKTHVLEQAKGGGIPGFQEGVDLSTMPESWSKKYTSWTDALAASDLEAKTGRFADLGLTNIGSRIQDLSGMSSIIPGVNGIYEINGQKYVIKGHDTADSALIESRGTQLTREIFNLNTPNQGFIKFAHPQTGQQMFGVMSPYDDTFANSTGAFGKENAVNQMLAAAIRRDKDLQADNFWKDIVGDVGAGFLGNKASQPRVRLDTPITDLETQIRANLLMDKAGARRHGAEATAPIIKEMGADGLTRAWQDAAKAALAKAEKAISNMPMMTPSEQKAYSYIIEDLRKASTMDMAPYFEAWASVEPQIKKPPTEKALATKEANKLKASMERAAALEAGYPRWAMQTGGIPGFIQGLTPLPMVGDLPSTIVYDIDKTLAGSVDFTKAAGQNTLDAWAAAAENAPVNSAELAKYNFLKSMGHKMAVVTARGAKYDQMTLSWLESNGIKFDEFISRPNGVTSSDPVFKRSVLKEMMSRANIAGFIDDKPANLKMASKLGIPAIEAISVMPKLQSGGSPWVPGSGEGDRIPAMLEPGEFVVNKNAAKQYGGLLNDINFNQAPRFQKGGITGFSTGGNTIEDIWGDGQRTFRAAQWQGPRLPIDYGFVTRTKELNRHPYFATQEEAEEYVRTEVAMKSLSGTEKNELRSLRQFVNDEKNLNYLASVWQQGSAGIRNHPERLEALLSYFMPIKDAMTLRRKTVLGVPGEMPTEQQVSILDALSSGAYDSIIGKKINLTGTPSAYTEWGFDWLAAKDFQGKIQQTEFRENQLTKAKEQFESAKRQVEALNDPNPQIAAMSRRYLEDRFRGWTSRKGVPFEENVATYLDLHERAIVSAQEDLAKLRPMGREPKEVMFQRLFKPGTSMLDITKINPNEKYRGTTLMEREWITGPGNPTIESVSQTWVPPSKMIGGQRAYQQAIENNLFPYVLNMKQRGGIQGFAEGLTSATGLNDGGIKNIFAKNQNFVGHESMEFVYDLGDDKGVALKLMRMRDAEADGWYVSELFKNDASSKTVAQILTHAREYLQSRGEDFSIAAMLEHGSYSPDSRAIIQNLMKSGSVEIPTSKLKTNTYDKSAGRYHAQDTIWKANNIKDGWENIPELSDWVKKYRAFRSMPIAAQVGGGIKGFTEGLTSKTGLPERYLGTEFDNWEQVGDPVGLHFLQDHGNNTGAYVAIRNGLESGYGVPGWYIETAMAHKVPQTAIVELLVEARKKLQEYGQDFSISAIKEGGSYSSHSAPMLLALEKMGLISFTEEERLALLNKDLTGPIEINNLGKATAHQYISNAIDQFKYAYRSGNNTDPFDENPGTIEQTRGLPDWRKEFLKQRRIPLFEKMGGSIPGFQTGGTPWVPGSGDGDRVPAMLEPGEFVVNKNAAKQYGGLLNHLNWEAAPRFSKGKTGPIPRGQESPYGKARVPLTARQLTRSEQGFGGGTVPTEAAMVKLSNTLNSGAAAVIQHTQALHAADPAIEKLSEELVMTDVALQDLSADGIAKLNIGAQKAGGTLTNIGDRLKQAGKDIRQGYQVGSGKNLREPTRSEMTRFGQTSRLPMFGTPANMYGKFGEVIGKVSSISARDIANAGKKLSLSLINGAKSVGTSLINGAKSVGTSFMIASKQIMSSAKQWYSQGMTFKQGMSMGQAKQQIWTGNYRDTEKPMQVVDRQGNTTNVVDPTGKQRMEKEKVMRNPKLSDATGVRGKAGFMWGKQAGGGMMGMMVGQGAGMAAMQASGNMQDGMAKSALSGAGMGAMMGGMIPGLGPVGGAMIGAIASGAMKAYGQWKEKLKNQADLLTDALTMDSVAMKHLGVTARDFSNIVYNASGKIVKSSSEFQQGVQDYKTSEDPLIVSALKGLADIAQGGDVKKIEELMRARFGGQLLATNGSPEARKKMYTDMQQFMTAGNVGSLTRQTIISGYKNIKTPEQALSEISKNIVYEKPETLEGFKMPGVRTTSKAGGGGHRDRALAAEFHNESLGTKSASALYSMQTTADPLQLGKAFDNSEGQAKDWMDSVNKSKDTWLKFKDIIKKSDPAMAQLDTHMHNLGVTTLQVTRINSLYQAGLAQMTDEQLKEIKANPTLLTGLELEAAARQSVNSTFSEYLANAQAHDAQMATQNSSEQKAADKAKAEQDRLNDLIDGANTYIDSEQKKINKIQKEKSAYDSLMQAQEQSIQNENTLNNLKSAVTRARAGGDLLAMADAQGNYNAELQKQADEKAKQAKDANYDKMMEKHQNNIDSAQNKITGYEKALKNLEKSTANAAKVAGENWNIIASKATPATDAVNGINDSVYGVAMQGGWNSAQELYEKVLGEDKGMAGKLKKAGMKAGDLKKAIFDFAKSASGTEMQTANEKIDAFGNKLDGIADKSKRLKVAQMLQATLTSQIASGQLKTKEDVKKAIPKNLSLIEEFYNVTDTGTATKKAKDGDYGYFNNKRIMFSGGKWYNMHFSRNGDTKTLLKHQPKKGDVVWTDASHTDMYKFADGTGAVRGPGGPKDDLIPALISNGEYVVNAAAVSQYGTKFMDMINARRFKDGSGPSSGPVMNDYMKSDSVHHQQIDGWKWDKKQKKYVLPTIKPKSITALNAVKPKNITRMFDTSAMNKSMRVSGQAGAGTFNSTINDHTVYNITVNAKTNASAEDIARIIEAKIKKPNKSMGTPRKQGAKV